jgi:hypothetical protein
VLVKSRKTRDHIGAY